MFYRIVPVFLSFIILGGCASTYKKPTIPDNVLNSLSTKWVIAEECYNSGDYDVQQLLDYQEAINYFVSTWNAPQSDINRVVSEKRQLVSELKERNDVLAPICKSWLVTMETDVRNANKHKEKARLIEQRNYEMRKAKATIDYSNGLNKTIQCTKLGVMTLNANVQVFKGSVCPLGWMPL
ncbi:hypothetical protein ACMAZD_05585 [Vibrio sp. nBUS_14]|uniref:hypothetical protein n=1 Tax=Vibrio sp. nBUS_14 TaxID=3395321 RepID=UPI003EB9D894